MKALRLNELIVLTIVARSDEPLLVKGITAEFARITRRRSVKSSVYDSLRTLVAKGYTKQQRHVPKQRRRGPARYEYIATRAGKKVRNEVVEILRKVVE